VIPWGAAAILAVLGVACGVVATILVARAVRRRRRRQTGPAELPFDAMVTAQAFGGYAVIVTPFHVVVYASELARTLPIASQEVLVHPQLADLADEVWAAGGTITRPFETDSLGPLRHVVAQAAVLDGRWVLLTLADRTEQVHTEEIRRDFIGNFSHELRTPITAVGLIAQTMQAAADSPETVAHFAQRLGQVAERLETMTTDMIALAMVQDDDVKRGYESVEIDHVVAQAREHQAEGAEAAHIKLRWPKRAVAHVWGDSTALTTAVENLLSNAIHYSPPGSRVTLTTRVDRAEGVVTISVIDQGIGIEPADQERIFERFYRADAARDRRTGGTGLGLAIVKRTALAHGGSVTVASQVGAGSTFSLHLPVM
jgi:two-component system sensor histidine kinase SenX3